MASKQRRKELMHDFTNGSVMKQLVLFASPLFLSSVLQIAYNMVDMLVVGQFAGKAGLSAVSIGGEVTGFLTMTVMGFSNAGSVIISQFVGANQKEKVGRFIGTLFSFLLSAAAVLSLIGFELSPQALRWLNTPPEAWDGALSYAKICMSGLVFIYGYNMVSAVLRGLGDSKHPFAFVAISAVMNAVLDVVFVAGFSMGAAGAALATVLSQTASFLISIVFLFRRRDSLGFEMNRACFRIDMKLLNTLLKLGVPMAIKQGAVSVSKMFVSSWVNSYGVTVSAVAGIGHKLAMVANLFSNAANTAGSAMVGQNIGARRYDRVPKILTSVLGITLGISAVLTAVTVLWPREMFGVFTKDVEVLKVAMEYVPVAAVCFLASSLRATANALINGSANFKVNFSLALLDGIVMRIGMSMLFGLVLRMGYYGFWMGDAVAGYTPAVMGIIYYLSDTWKTRKHVVKEENL